MEVSAVNPLLIPLVIKEVYTYLDFDDKKSFRLVCKSWIDTILQLWRKQTKLVIKLIEYNPDGRRNPYPEDILEYFNLYKIKDKPLRTLELCNLEFSFLPGKKIQKEQNYEKIAQISELQIVQKLLSRHFGHSLERFELVNCRFLETAWLEGRLHRILFKYFPNVKVLSVQYPETVSRYGDRLIMKKSAFQRKQSNLITLNLADRNWIKTAADNEIFTLFPKLKNLCLRGRACAFAETLTSPLPHSGKYLQLEKLGLDSASNPSMITNIPNWLKNYVEAARPPLKCLKATIPFGMLPLDIPWAEFPQTPFLYKPIWNCVGNTLTTLNLNIWMGLWSWCTLFTGCPLPKLTHLCLVFKDFKYDKKGEEVELLKFDFGMLRGTPLLKKLHLEFELMYKRRLPKIGTYIEGNELEWKGNAGSELRGPIVLEHMEDFRFELYHRPSQGCWKEFARTMPNLRKLQGMVDEDTEPLVKQLWPDLNLKWSTLLKQADVLMKDDERSGAVTVQFENQWLQQDWGKGLGKLD